MVILAGGRRLEDLCSSKLQHNQTGRVLNLSWEKLANFECYEASNYEGKDGDSPPKLTKALKCFPSVEMVDLSHNFLKGFDVLLDLTPNAWWINICYNDLEFLPEEMCLPAVMGSLDISHCEQLALDLSPLKTKHVTRLSVDLRVARERNKHGKSVETHNEKYMQRRAALIFQCPGVWVLNDSYIPAVERDPSNTGAGQITGDTIATREATVMVETTAVAAVVPPSTSSLLLSLSNSSWSSRAPTRQGSAFLSAQQSFAPKAALDLDCFCLDLALDDYLEEAKICNEKGICFHGIRGHRYPTLHLSKLMSLGREQRLDVSVLLSSYIINGIPEKIFHESMLAIVGHKMSFEEMKVFAAMPEFALTALICLLRRTVMREQDELLGKEGPHTNMRLVSVQPRGSYDFKHLKEVMSFLHGKSPSPAGSGNSNSSGGTGSSNYSPDGKIKSNKNVGAGAGAGAGAKAATGEGVVLPSQYETQLLASMPDIVTTHYVSNDEEGSVVGSNTGKNGTGNSKHNASIGSQELSIGGVSGTSSFQSWREMLAQRTLSILENSATYQQHNRGVASSLSEADAANMLDPLLKTAYRQQQMHRGSYIGSAVEELKSLSVVEEGVDIDDDVRDQNFISQDSLTGTKALVVSLQASLEVGQGLEAGNSLELSVDSGSGFHSPLHKGSVASEEDALSTFTAAENLDIVMPGAGGNAPRGSSPAKGAPRVIKKTTEVAVFTANRVASPQFGLLPLKQTIKAARNSPDGVALLHQVPVFVQPYQLPRLEADSVSVDKLGDGSRYDPSLLSHSNHHNNDAQSVGESSIASASVLSQATAARTMLAEMGTLRNVRDMMGTGNRVAQSKVDHATMKMQGGGYVMNSNDAGDSDSLGESWNQAPGRHGGGRDSSWGASGKATRTGTGAWFSGLVQSQAGHSRHEEKASSLTEFLETSWQHTKDNEDAKRLADYERQKNVPESLKQRVVTGVNDKLVSMASPIDTLRMATRYMDINMHPADTGSRGGPGGDVVYPEVTPGGRPLTGRWYPVKEKKQYVVANSPNQNPLQAINAETAKWVERQGSPISRGGGFTVRPTVRAQARGGPSPMELRGAVANKTVGGHNEQYWPLPEHHKKSELDRFLNDTSDIAITASAQGVDSRPSSMEQKIRATNMLRPASRGPMSAATTALPLNAGYKVKMAVNHEPLAPRVPVQALGPVSKKAVMSEREPWFGPELKY